MVYLCFYKREYPHIMITALPYSRASTVKCRFNLNFFFSFLFVIQEKIFNLYFFFFFSVEHFVLPAHISASLSSVTVQTQNTEGDEQDNKPHLV